MRPRLNIRFTLRQQWLFLNGKAYQPAKNEYLINHCRSGIMLALQALYMPAGCGVGVMAYNCHTVMNAVAQAGCKPVFIDVTDKLTISIEDLRKKRPEIRALVVTHLFGVYNDIKSIREEFPDLPIVEDCAHAYGIQENYGDFAVFSVGLGKLPSIGAGGILQVNNDEYSVEVKKMYDALPEYSILQSAKLFVKLQINAFMYLPWVYEYVTLPAKRRNRPVSAHVDIVPQKMCRGVSAIYREEKNIIAEHLVLRKTMAEAQAQSVGQMQGVRRVWYGENAFMLIAECDDPKALQQALWKQRIDSATHFGKSIVWAREFGYKDGTCPSAERLVGQLLMLPLHMD